LFVTSTGTDASGGSTGVALQKSKKESMQ